MSYYYFGQPYWHENVHVRVRRYEAGLLAYSHLIKHHIPVYAPIVLNHPAAMNFKMPLDDEFWLGLDYQIAKRAMGLIEFHLDGWIDSKGLNVERRWFSDRPSFYLPGRHLNAIEDEVKNLVPQLLTFPKYQLSQKPDQPHDTIS